METEIFDMAEMKCGGHFPRFWNKGGFALCVAGSADIRLNDRQYRLERGDVCVLTPLVHVGDFAPHDGFEVVSFIDDLRTYYPLFRLISDTSVPWQVRECPCWRLSKEETAYVTVQYGRIERKLKSADGCGSPEGRILLVGQTALIKRETMLEIVGNRIVRHPTAAKSATGRDMTAYRFILSLHDNYRVHRSVAWYASEEGLSPGHFSKIVKGVTGKSPSKWIATVTIAYIGFMLEQGGASIKEIANELNFPEQFTFCKYFKSCVGISPAEYRRRYGGKS